MNTLVTIFKGTKPVTFIWCFLFLVAGCSNDDEAEIKLSDKKQITSFVFLLTNNPIDVNVVASIDEENKTITATMPIGTNITGLIPEIEVSANTKITPSSAQDFTEPIEYTVTAQDESTAIYTVTITAKRTPRQILQSILDVNTQNTLGWNLDNITDFGLLPGVTTNSSGAIIELDMSQKNISVLPSEIGQLIQLKLLNLNLNQLTLLPDEIGQLFQLEELYLGDNQLVSLPSQLGLLSNLKILGLASNQIISLPIEIWQLLKLEKFNIGNNQLTFLSGEIKQLINLEDLDLAWNKLTSLPPEIGQLATLEMLSLYNNQLLFLPGEIGQMTKLTGLYLGDNQLTSLPPEIGFLSNLVDLRFNNNNVTEIPVSIFGLVTFNNLEVDHDDGLIYSSQSQKDALISIYSTNPANTLGWAIDNYPGVTFSEDGNPEAITINDKNISHLPDNIDQLSALEVLNVNSNYLKSLPSSLGEIGALTTITAASNQLETVPSELGQLSNLSLLSITNNPIASIPQEVCDLQTSNGGILTILTDQGEGCD